MSPYIVIMGDMDGDLHELTNEPGHLGLRAQATWIAIHVA
jgi:hypothetical protein